MSMANDAVWLPETAQTSPTITTTEVVTKVPAFGSIGGAQGGPLDEGCRAGQPQPPPNRSRPPLGPRSYSEAQERCRGGLSTPTDALVNGRTAGRAEEAEGAATLAYSFRPMWRISTYFCTCRVYVCVVYTNVVHGASQPCI